MTCKVLLKARPTRAQLADRFSEPVPPGMELYLDARDVNDLERLERLAHRLQSLRPGPDFVYVVEGPLRSLDGHFFDISTNGEAQRECVRRITWLASEIGAEAVLVHAIAPRKLGPNLSEELHTTTLEASLAFVQYYVDLVQSKGMVPLVENIPPVARQREAAYMCTPVGMRARDLVYFAERFPGLKVAVDVSHAQLFLNALSLWGAEKRNGMDRMGTDSQFGVPKSEAGRVRGEAIAHNGGTEALGDGELRHLATYLATVGDEPAMEAYLAELEPYLFEAHISNARGVLEEGLPYSDGDMDLDAVALSLSRSVRYLVTETIEPDADRGVHMREAQSRLEAAIRGVKRGTEQDRQDGNGWRR